MKILQGLGLSIIIICIVMGCAHRKAVENSANATSGLAPSENEKLHEVIVSQVVVEQSVRGGAMPVVILVNKENDEQFLPIWVGATEGRSINKVLSNLTSPRPETHDLFADVLGQFQMKLISVVITDLHDNTYFATMTVELDGETKEIDARPSDAIALALRRVSPIFVSDRVIDKGGWAKMLERNEKQPRKRRKGQSEAEKKEDNLL